MKVSKYPVLPLEQCLVRLEYILHNPKQVMGIQKLHHILLIQKKNMLSNIHQWIYCTTKPYLTKSHLNQKVFVYQQELGTYHPIKPSLEIQNFAAYVAFHPYYQYFLVMIVKMHQKVLGNGQLLHQ